MYREKTDKFLCYHYVDFNNQNYSRNIYKIAFKDFLGDNVKERLWGLYKKP